MSGLVAFDKARAEELLTLLDQRLARRGVAASIYLVGGVAIALTVLDGRRTQDVDALVSHQAVLEEAADLAVEQGLPPGWLNQAAAPWVPAREAKSLRRPTKPGLTVHVAPKRHLLAMKLIAMRRQDVPDIVALAADLEMTDATAEDFAGLLAEVYAGEGVLAQMVGPGVDPRTEALLLGEAAVRAIARG